MITRHIEKYFKDVKLPNESWYDYLYRLSLDGRIDMRAVIKILAIMLDEVIPVMENKKDNSKLEELMSHIVSELSELKKEVENVREEQQKKTQPVKTGTSKNTKPRTGKKA